MMKHRDFLYALSVGLALSQPVSGQRGVPVRGVVYDSLRGQPIRNASVSIAGTGRVITTDSRGRFQFDSVAPGDHRFTAQHPVLDSIGFTGLLAHSVITDGRDEVRLAVPSFETLWHVACGGGRVPKDSAIVYGTIRAASDGAPAADVRVELIWSDLMLDRQRHVVQRRWHIETRTNAVGGYALCGIAVGLGLQVHAGSNGVESGLLDMPPLTTRVQRRDLTVGSSTDSSAVGAITGVVTGPSGEPMSDVRIVIPDLPETRSDSAGRFTVPAVPPGTRQVEVLAIGSASVVASADVVPHGTTPITVTLPKAVTLETMRTVAERNVRVFAAEFEARRKLGFGYVRDSSEILKYDQFVNVLRDVPGLNVQYRSSTLTISVPDGKGSACPPDVVIDGVRAGFGNLIDLSPKEIGGVEVYPRAAHIPPRFVAPGIQPQCGMILVWTKYGLKNR